MPGHSGSDVGIVGAEGDDLVVGNSGSHSTSNCSGIASGPEGLERAEGEVEDVARRRRVERRVAAGLEVLLVA